MIQRAKNWTINDFEVIVDSLALVWITNTFGLGERAVVSLFRL